MHKYMVTVIDTKLFQNIPPTYKPKGI